jgi:hypothetical protein
MEDIINIQTAKQRETLPDKKSLMHSILDEGFNELIRSR